MKKSPSITSSFRLRCSAEWHLARFGNSLACPIYNLAMHLAFRSGRLVLSVRTLAEYFHADYDTVARAIRKLEREGLFVRLRSEPGRPVAYRPVAHDVWKVTHPERCLEKVEMPWSEEQKDPLAIRLFAASDGTMPCYPNFLKGARNTGHSDDAIVAHFEAFYANDREPKKGRFGRFMSYLRRQPVVGSAEAVFV
jgi:hypothetical protein